MNRFKRKYSILNLLDVLAWVSFFVSNYFTAYFYHLFVPSVYLIVRAILRRKHIQTDLKNAVDYCRTRKPIWKLAVRMAIVVLVGMTLAYAYEYVESFIKKVVPKPTSAPHGFIVVTLCIVTLSVARLQNFYSGVRWYISGIKLPGERSLLIPWRLVDEVKLEGEELSISALGKRYEYRIKGEDLSSADSFQRWFEKKKSELSESINPV